MSFLTDFGNRLGFKWDRVWAFLTLLPSVLVIFVFVYIFMGWNILISFSRWKGIVPNYTLNGLKNYIRLFRDQRFQIDIKNILVFAVVFILGCIVIGLLLAILLDRNVRGEIFFRNVYLLCFLLHRYDCTHSSIRHRHRYR